MVDLFFQPVLADFDNVVGVIVLIIAFLGWIMNFISNKNKEAQQTTERHSPRQPAQRNERREDDVEMFLEEVNERRQPRQSRLKEQRNQTGQPASVPAPVSQRTPPRPLVQKPEEAVLELVETELGAGVRQHLQQYMTPNRIDQGVKQHMASSQELGRGVQQSVAEHLKGNIPPGRQAALMQAALALSGKGSSRAGVIAMLKNPQAVKQAILINEILSPPKARRPRR